MEVSRFFTLTELTHSETAAREKIPNQPGATELAQLRALCTEVLDPLRTALARPIKVSSGYRSPTLNRRIGGAATSQHVTGQAADIQVAGLSVLELFKAVIRLELPFDQLIYEAASKTSRWVHVSHDPKRQRQQIMVAKFGRDGRAYAYPKVTAQAALRMSEPVMASRDAPELTYVETADEPAAAVVKAKRSTPRKPASTKLARPQAKAKQSGAKSRVRAKTQARPAPSASSKRARRRKASKAG